MSKTAHSITTIILAILFICSLGWTFVTQGRNEDLINQNEELTSSLTDLQDVNRNLSTYYGSQIDSIRKVNEDLNRRILEFKQQLEFAASRESVLKEKYNKAHERIQTTADISVQLTILEELLTRNTQLREANKN